MEVPGSNPGGGSKVKRLRLLPGELFCGFWGADRFAHDEEPLDAPRNEPIDENRQERCPLDDAAFQRLAGAKYSLEWCHKNSGNPVNKRREACGSIGAEQFEHETEGEERFKKCQNIPDNLRAAIERL